MKTILLPLESGDGLQSMLETAWLAASAFGSTIQGLYIRVVSQFEIRHR